MSRVPIFMDNPQYDEISKKVRQSYPKSCILFIDEICNSELEEKHAQFGSFLKEKYGSNNEMLLFHGTHAKIIDKIATEGFDPSKNVVSAFGRGTYFAKNASYSMNYMKSSDKSGISYMFLAKVYLGNIVQYPNPDKSKDFDSFTDNIYNPTIYVVPHQYAAYPKYIIAFHKEAK